MFKEKIVKQKIVKYDFPTNTAITIKKKKIAKKKKPIYDYGPE